MWQQSSKLSCPDATYVAFTAFRLIGSAGRQSSKAKLSRYHLVRTANKSFLVEFLSFKSCKTLSSDLLQISTLFQNLDGGLKIYFVFIVVNVSLGTRNEVAHAQYTAQISHRTSDVLSQARTAISDLVPNEISILEATLSFFLAIWLRLQADCLDVVNWIQNNRVSRSGNLKLVIY